MTPEEKIINLEARVDKLEAEVSELKALVSKPVASAAASNPVVQPNPAVPTRPDTSYSGRLAQSQNIADSSKQGSSTLYSPVAQGTPAAQFQPAPQKAQDKKSLEDKIGRNVMGIAASVLIFLGIILLGVIIYDFLSDVVKLVAMYAISLVPTVLGLTKMKKADKYKTFYTTLAGCGMGALYISLILTHYVFGVIGELVLVVLLLAWTLFAAWLSKARSAIFVYICYAGLTISTFLCATKWEGFPISLVFYGLGIGVLFAINRSKEYNKNAFYFIQLPVIATLLTFIYSDSPIIRLVIVLVPLIVLFVQNIGFKLTEKNNCILIPTTVLTYISMMVAVYFLRNDIESDIVNYAFTLIFVIISAFYYYVHNKVAQNKLPFLVAYYFTVLAMLGTFDTLLWIPAAGLLIAGILMHEEHFRYVGYAFTFLCICGPGKMYPSLVLEDKNIFSLLIAIAIVFASILLQKKNPLKLDKYLQTGLLCLIPIVMYHYEIVDMVMALVCLSAISLVCNQKSYYTDKQIGSIDMTARIIAYVINGIAMLTVLACLSTYHDGLTIYAELSGTEWLATIIMILLGVVLFMVNTLKLFDLKLPEMVVGVYIGVKLTVLMVTILNRFDAAGFLISIICLVLAVISIVVGFSLKRKPFRLYGLVLTLLCVAKLIVVDINYSTSLLRPIGFIGAGILCFGISWIYSRIEKSTGIEVAEAPVKESNE